MLRPRISRGGAPARQPMGIDRFTRHEVLRILGVAEKQLDYWERLRLVEPRKTEGHRFYNFTDLIGLRTAKQLIEQGVPAYRLRRSLLALKQRLAEVKAPLTELRILSSGRDIVVEQHGARIEPLSGQHVLNFETRELGQRVRVIERNAEEWFALALQLENSASTRAEACDAYRNALAIKPDWTEALTNLGTLLYEQGDFQASTEYFRRAADLEPQNPVVHYNLGSVLEETGQAELARKHLRRAVELKPDYPDAHYNLAIVCERLRDLNEAREHWRQYLELDPASPWCEYARQRLSAESRFKSSPPLPKSW